MVRVGPSYQEAKPGAVRSDAALVFVVRDYAEPTAISADITVDKAAVVDLNQKGTGGFITLLGSGLNGVSEEYALRKLEVCKFQRPRVLAGAKKTAGRRLPPQLDLDHEADWLAA